MMRLSRKRGGGLINALRKASGFSSTSSQRTALTYNNSDVDTLLELIGDQIPYFENPYTNITRISSRDSAKELVKSCLKIIYAPDKTPDYQIEKGTKLAGLIIKLKELEKRKGKSAEGESFTNEFTIKKLLEDGYPDFSELLGNKEREERVRRMKAGGKRSLRTRRLHRRKNGKK